jgi:predicted metal-binding membrane protein
MTGMNDSHASTAGRYRPALMSSVPSARQPIIVWAGLLVFAVAGWAVTVIQAQNMSGMSGMSGMSPASSPPVPFLSAWVAMMVAMMFPSVAPTVTSFATVAVTRRRAGERVAPAWVFLLGYLAVWSIFGLGAYLLSLLAPDVGMMGPGLRATSPFVAGSILVVAGVYQWSRWKRSCLEHCRSPLAFLQEGWDEGTAGAFRLGLANGVQCIGCCGGLMLVLLAVGLMNLGWMAALATVFFAEKVVPHGPLVGKLAGAAIVITGVAML